MAQIILNVPDASLNRVVDALCIAGGYTPAQGTKAAFAKAFVIKQMMGVVRDVEARIAAEAEAEAVRAQVDGINVT